MSIETYNIYRNSGIGWIGEIPEHWEIRKLKYWVDFLNYRRIPISAEIRGDLDKIYPYYGASGIIDYIDDYIFDEPLILIAEDGANLISRSTPLAFIARGKYWVNNHAHILKPKNGNLEFWAFLLESMIYDSYITGSAQPKLSMKRLSKIEFAAPQTEEQDLIAEYLKKKTSEIDTLIAEKEKMAKLLQEYRQAIINEAVTKGLNPNISVKDSGIEWIKKIPEDWELIKLKFISKSIRDGTHAPPPRTDNGIPLLSARNIKDGFIDWNENYSFISEEDYIKINRTNPVKMDDVLLTIVGTLGRTCVLKEEIPFTLQRSVAIIRLNQKTALPLFLQYFFMSAYFQDLLINFSKTSAQTGIYLVDIKNLKIILAPLARQKKIAEFLDQKIAEIDSLMSNFRNQIEELKIYRQSLILEAVTGKIDVRNYIVKNN